MTRFKFDSSERRSQPNTPPGGGKARPCPGTSVAIFLWSLAALQTGRLARGFAWYGLAAASLITLALLGGHIRLDVHGFALVWLAQSIWFVVAGCLLMRSVAGDN